MDWLYLLGVQYTLESSPTPQFRSINSALSFLYSPNSHPYMTTGKTIALTRRTFVGKVMFLLFNMLSGLVITFLNPGGSEVKESACNAGDLGSIPGSGRSPGEGNGNPLQCSCLENPMDGGVWWASPWGPKSSTRPNNFTFTFLKGESVF